MFTEAFEEALDYGTRALDLARASGDGELEIEMTGRVALSQMFLGGYGPVIAELRSILPRVREETPKPRFFGLILTAVMILDPLAQVLAERGEFDEATLLADEAIRRAEQLDPRYSLATACYWAGRVHLRRGELARATELLERSLGVCRAVNAAAVLPLAASHLGWAYALLDRHAEALPLLLEAIEKGARGWDQSLQLVMLGEVYLRAGRVLEAGEVAERALVRV